MKLPRFLILAALVLGAPNPARSQVGSPLPPADLEGFAQTPAKSLDEYAGRVLLLEYFAHW